MSQQILSFALYYISALKAAIHEISKVKCKSV